MTTAPAAPPPKPQDRAGRPDGPSPGFALVTVLIGLGFAVIWSSAFTSAKIALQYAPPLLMLSVRFAIAGLMAVALGLALGDRLPRQAGQWVRLAVLGVCQNSLYLGLMFVAMTSIAAGLAAIIGSAMPLVVAAMAPVFLAERVGPLKLSGMVLGFAGVIWVMVSHFGDPAPGGVGQVTGIILAAIGTVALSVATTVIKRGAFGTGIWTAIGLQMLVGSITLLPFGLALESWGSFSLDWGFFGAMAYIILGPSLAATWLWFTLLSRTTATSAGAYHFLNPIFGVGIAFIVLGEQLTAWDALGVVLVAVGILMVNRAGAR
jgi:drug/metabolite transporter (DMT)-like permease